jgi:hypothetical protein
MINIHYYASTNYNNNFKKAPVTIVCENIVCKNSSNEQNSSNPSSSFNKDSDYKPSDNTSNPSSSFNEDSDYKPSDNISNHSSSFNKDSDYKPSDNISNPSSSFNKDSDSDSDYKPNAYQKKLIKNVKQKTRNSLKKKKRKKKSHIVRILNSDYKTKNWGFFRSSLSSINVFDSNTLSSQVNTIMNYVNLHNKPKSGIKITIPLLDDMQIPKENIIIPEYDNAENDFKHLIEKVIENTNEKKIACSEETQEKQQTKNNETFYQINKQQSNIK